MDADVRAPAGPRGAIGAAAEEAAARHLEALGWTVLARNLRVGRDELDIVALEPGPRPSLVIVEVRSRSGPRFGSALESVDARKVRRLYRAAMRLLRAGDGGLADGSALGIPPAARLAWRVDLLALQRGGPAGWRVEQHLRGLRPP